MLLVEKQRVTEWIQENPENMREYMAQRKLHDMALRRTEPVAEENSWKKETFPRYVGDVWKLPR